MTVVTTIAQRVLDENNWSTSDISLVNCEYLIKNAVDYFNSQTGRTVTFVPSGGTQSLTANDDEFPIIKALTVLMIRAYKDRGPNVSISGLGVNTLISDPQYSLYVNMIAEGIKRIRTVDRSSSPPIYVSNDPVETEE